MQGWDSRRWMGEDCRLLQYGGGVKAWAVSFESPLGRGFALLVMLSSPFSMIRISIVGRPDR